MECSAQRRSWQQCVRILLCLSLNQQQLPHFCWPAFPQWAQAEPAAFVLQVRLGKLAVAVAVLDLLYQVLDSCPEALGADNVGWGCSPDASCHLQESLPASPPAEALKENLEKERLACADFLFAITDEILSPEQEACCEVFSYPWHVDLLELCHILASRHGIPAVRHLAPAVAFPKRPMLLSGSFDRRLSMCAFWIWLREVWQRTSTLYIHTYTALTEYAVGMRSPGYRNVSFKYVDDRQKEDNSVSIQN